MINFIPITHDTLPNIDQLLRKFLLKNFGMRRETDNVELFEFMRLLTETYESFKTSIKIYDTNYDDFIMNFNGINFNIEAIKNTSEIKERLMRLKKKIPSIFLSEFEKIVDFPFNTAKYKKDYETMLMMRNNSFVTLINNQDIKTILSELISYDNFLFKFTTLMNIETSKLKIVDTDLVVNGLMRALEDVEVSSIKKTIRSILKIREMQTVLPINKFSNQEQENLLDVYNSFSVIVIKIQTQMSREMENYKVSLMKRDEILDYIASQCINLAAINLQKNDMIYFLPSANFLIQVSSDIKISLTEKEKSLMIFNLSFSSIRVYIYILNEFGLFIKNSPVLVEKRSSRIIYL